LIIGVKTEDQTVAAGHSIDPGRWQETFEILMGRIAGRFVRVKPRRRARAFVCGLLPRRAWQKLSAGAGTKGHRFYDWALAETADDRPGHHQLLVGRNRRTSELALSAT
jgi:hypothetical protein